MKLRIKAADLAGALAAVTAVVPARPTMSAYSGIYFQVDGELVTLTASDGTTTIQSTLPAEALEDGHALILPKAFHSLVDSFQSKVIIEVTADSADLSIKPEGGSKYTLRVIAATFPSASLGADITMHPVDWSTLGTGIGAIRATIPKDAPNVQVVSDQYGLRVDATDRVRIAAARLTGGGFGEARTVIPVAVLDRAAKLKVTEVGLGTVTKLFAMTNGSTRIVTRTVADPYLPVDRFLTELPDEGIEFDVNLASVTAKRMQMLAGQTPVICEIVDGEWTMSAANPDTGTGSETIPVKNIRGGEIRFAVGAAYLTETLAGLVSDKAKLFWTGPLQALFVTSDAGKLRTRHVLMPVRMPQ